MTKEVQTADRNTLLFKQTNPYNRGVYLSYPVSYEHKRRAVRKAYSSSSKRAGSPVVYELHIFERCEVTARAVSS